MAVHQRMHGHGGFHAIQNGTIDRSSYGMLLSRLFGFYRALEQKTDLGGERSAWLRQDLADLGFDLAKQDALETCGDIPRLDTPNRHLGALYVVAGSALGGRHLARSVDHLFPVDETTGRHFFLGHGAQTGVVWRDYLAQLAAVPPDHDTQIEIVDAALETFLVFERWSSDWKDQ